MKNSVFPPHRKLALCAAATILALGLSAPLTAQTGNLVDQAKTLLEQDRYVEALAAAKDAVRLDMNDHQAHYYVAMAYLGLQQYEPANDEATAALALAPASDRAGVQKLVDTIKSLQRGNQSVSEADTALADGLIGKAARLYEDAWTAGKNAPDFAFKAADLYANRLGQPVDAARVLRQVQRAQPGSVSSDKAATALKKIEGTLRQIATTQVNAARGKSWADAVPNLKAAEDADPDYVEIYKLRTQIAAATGTTGQLQDSLKELARRNLIDIEYLAALPGLDARFAQPGFEQFLIDVMGVNQTATLKQSASPAGRIAFVSNLAQQGKITFFLGRKQDGNTNSFKVWTRRNVSGVRLTGQCTVAVGLGGSLGNSAELAAYNPSTLTLDMLQMRGAPVFNNTAIELGRTMKDWDMAAFGVPDGGTLAQQVSDALNYAYSACPRPVKKR